MFYEPELLGPLGSTLMMLNPLSPILEGIRLAAIEHHNLLVPIEGEAGLLIWHPWHLGYAADATSRLSAQALLADSCALAVCTRYATP